MKIRYLAIIFLFFPMVVYGEAPQLELNKELIGKYEYVDPHNSDELIENHYLVLEDKDGVIVGRYYGTSDDFDEGREGYLPGFYVVEVSDLSIVNQRIDFKVSIKESDLFLNTLGTGVKDTRGVNVKKHPRWIKDYQTGLTLTKHSILFTGEINRNNLILDLGKSKRKFRKAK